MRTSDVTMTVCLVRAANKKAPSRRVCPEEVRELNRVRKARNRGKIISGRWRIRARPPRKEGTEKVLGMKKASVVQRWRRHCPCVPVSMGVEGAVE